MKVTCLSVIWALSKSFSIYSTQLLIGTLNNNNFYKSANDYCIFIINYSLYVWTRVIVLKTSLNVSAAAEIVY